VSGVVGSFAGRRHREERSDEAIQTFLRGPGLLRFARNDEGGGARALSSPPASSV
jgi:hypothetical protein